MRIKTAILLASFVLASLAKASSAQELELQQLKLKGLAKPVGAYALINYGKKKPYLIVVDQRPNGSQNLVRLTLNNKGKGKKLTILHSTPGVFHSVGGFAVGKRVYLTYVIERPVGGGPSPADGPSDYTFYGRYFSGSDIREPLAVWQTPFSPNSEDIDTFISAAPYKNNKVGVAYGLGYRTIDNTYSDFFFGEFDQYLQPTSNADRVDFPTNFNGQFWLHSSPLVPLGSNCLVSSFLLHSASNAPPQGAVYDVTIKSTPSGDDFTANINKLTDFTSPVRVTNVVNTLWGDYFDISDSALVPYTKQQGPSTVPNQDLHFFGVNSTGKPNMTNPKVGDIPFDTYSSQIFTDGFESGDVSAWSRSTPPGPTVDPATGSTATYFRAKFLKAKKGSGASNEQHYEVYAIDINTGKGTKVASATLKENLNRPLKPLSAIMRNNELWIIFSGINDNSGNVKLYLARVN